jgi:ABC-2 type transport system permease protein
LSEARRPGFLSVAARELNWLRHDVVGLALVLVIPLLAIAVLSLTFSNAVVRNLQVDVVDQDQTRTS